MTASFINELNKTNGKLDKEEVIRKTLVAAKLGSTEAQRCLRLYSLTYNNFVVFGVRQIPETRRKPVAVSYFLVVKHFKFKPGNSIKLTKILNLLIPDNKKRSEMFSRMGNSHSGRI